MMNRKRQLWHILHIANMCVAIFLNACTSPHLPLKITAISVSPEPVVGRIVNLQVEVVSSEDAPDTTIFIDLPDEVKVIGGGVTKQIALQASQSQTHAISICVVAEGEWRIAVYASSKLSEQSVNADVASVYVTSTLTAAQVISSDEYRYDPPPGGVSPKSIDPINVMYKPSEKRNMPSGNRLYSK
jgi:hypothetical protein